MSDRYQFEKVGTKLSQPVYLVRNADGERIGVIERCRASTDGVVGGRGGRIRRPGKGRDEWRPACGSPRGESNEWEPYRSYMPGLSYLTRSDAASQFDGHWGNPMSEPVIDAVLASVDRP